MRQVPKFVLACLAFARALRSFVISRFGRGARTGWDGVRGFPKQVGWHALTEGETPVPQYVYLSLREKISLSGRFPLSPGV